MKEAQYLIEFTRDLIERSNIEKIDETIENAMDSLMEYTDTIGELITPAKAFFAVFSVARRLKMKAFLKQYALKVNLSLSLSEKDLERLRKYMSNKRNLEFVSEIIDSAMNSRASLCSAILGFYAGEILSDSKNITYRDTIVVNALKIMIDEDITNFLDLYNLITNNPTYSEFKEQHVLKRFKEIEDREFEMALTIEKLKSVQAIGFGLGGPYTPSGWGVFLFNENTRYLFDLIQKASVVNRNAIFENA